MPTIEVITGIVSGCEVTAQGTPNTTAAVAAGFVIVNGTVAAVAAGNVTPGVADATGDRVDVVVADSTGALSVVAGTVADGANAIAPTIDDTVYAVLKLVLVVSQASPSYTGTITSSALVNTDGATATTVVYQQLPEPANTMAYTFVSGALSNADPGANNFGFDSSTIASITAAYVDYTSPTVGGSIKTWFIPGTGGRTPYYLLVWSRKNPTNYMMLSVTAVASHGSGAGTYVELTCTVAYTSTGLSTVQLSTDVFDSILEFVGPVPPALPTTWTIAHKTANTSRASTTTLTADPDLQFAVAANTNYIIRGAVRFDANSATPGFKFDFDGPAAPTRVMASIWDCAQAGTPAALALDSGLNVAHTLATASGNTPGYIGFEIIIENGANAGTFSLRWAQNASGVQTVNVRPGSYLEYLIS